ncbi:MAG: hypothetical protein U0794_20345 [Isosphaeraceae bacterium]
MFTISAPTSRRRRFSPSLDSLPLRLAPSTGPMDPGISPTDSTNPPADISPMDPTIGCGSTFQPQTPSTT